MAIDHQCFMISAAVDTDYVRGFAFGCREPGPRAPCDTQVQNYTGFWKCSFRTCTHHSRPLQPAEWLPRLSRAPSQLSRRDLFDVTAPPLRLSGGSPDSLSGDAKEVCVACEGAAALQRCKSAKHLQRCKALLPQVSSPAKAERSAFGQVAQRF